VEVAGAKGNPGEELEAGGESESPLWSPVADGSSGVRLKRPLDPRRAQLLSGQYKLLSPLGPSPYGRAFMAEHVPHGRKVAVHFLPRDATSERVLSRDLPLAVAKCAQLSHPNVVSVEACGRAEGPEAVYYVVTAPLEGVSLADLLHSTGPLPIERALNLMRQIGRALRAAHKLGVVHGDLRPSNVRVVQTPQGELAKVVGFGKAVLMQRTGEPTSEIRGITSPVYAAPELYQSGLIDARSDVYSLGALLFRLIAGEPPYPGRTPGDVMEGHLSHPIPSLRARAGDHVPPEVDALVMRCLEKQPSRRFLDVVAFMQAMRFALLDDQEFLSREASDLLSLPPPGVNSILPSVPNMSLDIDAEPAPAPAESVRSNAWLWFVLGGLLLLAVLGEIWWETRGSAESEITSTPLKLP
jgi:serine/threonine protein kinase